MKMIKSDNGKVEISGEIQENMADLLMAVIEVKMQIFMLKEEHLRKNLLHDFNLSMASLLKAEKPEDLILNLLSILGEEGKQLCQKLFQ